MKISGILCIVLSLTLVLGGLERLIPARRGQRLLREGFRVDLTWWFFTPLLGKPVTEFGIILSIVPIALLLGLPLDETLKEGHGPLAELPVAMQFGLVMIGGDFVGYWVHRLHHTRFLWPLHAVHHSSTELDWMSSVRVHPFNTVTNRAPRIALMVIAGFDLTVVAAYVPFLTFYALLLHANTRIRFPAPLKWMLVSPRYHRWHHAKNDGVNHAGLLPIWDLMFGTYHLPDRDPEAFGCDDPVPVGFFAHLIWPFRPSAWFPALRRSG